MKPKINFLNFDTAAFLVLSLFLASVFVLAQPVPPSGSQQTVTVTLDAGWNMISSPTGTPIPIEAVGYPTSIYSTCKRYPSTPVWHLSSSVPGWQRSDISFLGAARLTSIEPNKGYWVWVNETCTFTATGNPRPGNAQLVLLTGWNMISNPASGILTVNDIKGVCGDKVTQINGIPLVWHLDGTTQGWQYSLGSFSGLPKIENINAGLGYYINIISGPCTIEFVNGVVSGGANVPIASTTTSTTSGSAGSGGSFGSGSTTTTATITSTTGQSGSTTTVSSGSTTTGYSGSTTTTTSTILSYSSLIDCPSGCGKAYDLGTTPNNNKLAHCTINRGARGYYNFTAGSSEDLNIIVGPAKKTNSVNYLADIDLYVYSANLVSGNAACTEYGSVNKGTGGGVLVCSKTGSGAGAEICTISASNGNRYFIEIVNYDNSAYEDKAIVSVEVNKKK